MLWKEVEENRKKIWQALTENISGMAWFSSNLELKMANPEEICTEKFICFCSKLQMRENGVFYSCLSQVPDFLGCMAHSCLKCVWRMTIWHGLTTFWGVAPYCMIFVWSTHIFLTTTFSINLFGDLFFLALLFEYPQTNFLVMIKFHQYLQVLHQSLHTQEMSAYH